jgi:hypothetical protein
MRLVVVKLGPAMAAAWQVSRLPPNHGSISAGLENTLLRSSIAMDGVAVWAGSVLLASSGPRAWGAHAKPRVVGMAPPDCGGPDWRR